MIKSAQELIELKQLRSINKNDPGYILTTKRRTGGNLICFDSFNKHSIKKNSLYGKKDDFKIFKKRMPGCIIFIKG